MNYAIFSRTMKSKVIESFMAVADSRVRQYVADTLGNDFKVKQVKKQPVCHHSVKYNVDFRQTAIEDATSAALVWKNPTTGLYRISGVLLYVTGKDTLAVMCEERDKLYDDITAATFRVPAVICLGGDPFYSELHKISIPEQVDAYWAAGFVKEGSIKVIECFTQDLLIPVDCEATAEGYFQRNELPADRSIELRFHASCFTQPL